MKSHAEKPLLLLALILSALVLFAAPGHCADKPAPVNFAAGVNGAWLDGPGAAFPADVEAGGSAFSSLSPHLSAFADAYYGFSHSYLRWDGGVKATVTDVDNKNLSVYLALKYRGGSIRAMKPDEWAAGTGIGWKPNPAAWPRLVIGADASYGLESNRVIAYLAARYLIPLN